MSELYVANTFTSLSNQHLPSLVNSLESCGTEKWKKKSIIFFQGFFTYLIGGKTDDNSEKNSKSEQNKNQNQNYA